MKREVLQVSSQEALADLLDYQRQLEQRFAYLKANHVDYRDAVDRVRSRITDPMPVTALQNELAQVTAMFIDGHARPGVSLHSEKVLSFSIVDVGGRQIALTVDRKSILDSDHPYISHIDGLSIGRWTAVVDPFIVAGSPQIVRRRTLREIRNLPALRTLIGRPQSNTVQVRLVSRDGSSAVGKQLGLVDEPPSSIDKPERPSRWLKDEIAYLRIPSMNDDAVLEIREWMPVFKNARGLIVDVRGNGGGSREALLELMPYFMNIGETHIGNVAAYRLYDEFPEGHLATEHFMYRESDPRWNKSERRVIDDFKSGFVPEWSIPVDEFSDWHYLLLSKQDEDPRYFFDRPVVILIDSGCFSATDIFVGAFKGWRNVTLMGTPTGGGSARSVTEELPNSGIHVSLASMASFQPDGQLFDGRGIQPDVYVEPSPESFLIGGRDNILDKAICLIDKIGSSSRT